MLQATCTPSADDWNTPGIGVQSTNQGGTYSTSGKDDGNPSTWSSSGHTPDKTNFEQAYATSRVVNGHFYVFVAWERSNSTGTQGYAIEIDNSGAHTAADGTPQPNRGSGGSVFYISSQGSSAPTFDSACSFTSQATYGTTCTSSNSSVTSAINTSSISDPLRGTTQVAGTFFEAALDVTALTGIAPSCPGPSAASVYLRSITGQTHNGNLKGYMAPLSVAPNSTCVAPHIDTTANPGGALNAVGSTQDDTVTVGNYQGSPAGVGTVTFFLCSPAVVTANGGDCSANGTQVGQAKTLDANGQATSANVTGATTPNDNATGTYCWRAEFTPSANDHNYLPGTHTNSSTECFTIVHGTPSIATQIAVTGAHQPGLGFTTLGDSADLTGFEGSVANETITFTLYGPFAGAVPANCAAGTPAFTTTGALNAGGHATTSSTFTPTQAGTYIWIASYPGDTLNDPVTGKCTDANESETIVAAQIDVAKSANPPGPVSAGETIGFDLTVTNDGSVPAAGVHVHDTLPAGADGVAGGDLNWSLDPAYTGCSITGSAGNQALDCTFSEVDGPGSLPVIHISSPTSPADCGTVKNKATITTTNGTGTDSDVATVTVLCPHLSIDKTADAASVTVGSPIGFTVTATNDGQGTASGVLINDPLPTGPGITWSIDAAGTSGPLSCVIQSGTLKCTGSLAAGASQVVHITSPTQWTSGPAGVVNSCLGGPNNDGLYVNTATVSATNVVGSPSDGAQEQVLCPNLGIAKTADAAAVNAGTAIGFTITATNSGAGNAAGALLSDPLPAGVTWTIDPAGTSGPLSCQIQSGTLSCTGTLGAGVTETVHITAPTSFVKCGTYNNDATLTATNTPQAPDDGATTKVLCADVVVHKTADADSVSVGSQIGFSIAITNLGDGQALGVHVNDPLPAGQGVSWGIVSQNGPLTCVIDGSAPNQTLKCTGDLAASGNTGDVHTVHITSTTVWNADLNSCGEYDNTAHLTWDNGPATTISSNEATETVLCPDLDITKTADAASVSAGADIGFQIEVTNAGPGTATSATIHDPLPGGSDVSWSIKPAYSGPGTCSISVQNGAQFLDCSLGDLAPGADVIVHVSSSTTQHSCGDYDNTATLHVTNAPGKQGRASTTVLCPDVSLDKTADDVTVSAGAQIGFTITVSNSDAAGTGTAAGVVIDDPLPFGPSLDWSVSPAVTGCAVSTDQQTGHQSLHCAAVDLAPGASESVHVVSGTAFVSCAELRNTATATGSNFDQLQASATVTVQCPDISLDKTADDATVSAGSDIGFTLSVANAGPGTASGLALSDTLPGGAGVSWSISPAYSGPGSCSIAVQNGDQVLSCSFGDVGPGASFSVHISSGTTEASCIAYPNNATLGATNAPDVQANATTTVLCPDVTLDKTADDAVVSAGDQVGFTIRASNSDAEGTGTATGVVIDDPLPFGAGLDWSMDPAVTGCAVSTDQQTGHQSLHCDAVDLAPGDTESVHVVSGTSFASCAQLPNTATATGGNFDQLQASASVTVQCPDLTLVKTADTDTALPGDTIGFTITVSNSNEPGTGTAHSVVIDDPLPTGAGVMWSIVSGPQNCAIELDQQTDAATLHCDAVELGAGESFSAHVTSPTTAASCQAYPNTVNLTAANHPSLEASATTTVQCPDVTLVKTADADTVNAGEQIGFTITASNSDAEGTGTATDVVINDPLPSGTGIDWSIESGPENCVIDGVAPDQMLDCTAVDLAPGESESVHIVSTTSADSCAVYDNTATLILSDGTAPEPASASTTVQCPALGIIKTADAARVRAGNPIGFTVTVNNDGPGTALGATLTDPLPAGKGVSWSVDTAGSTAPGCAITDGPDGQLLSCALGDLAAGTSYAVHVVSDTTDVSCATYPNVATLDATNAAELTADADTKVIDCLGTGPESSPPPSSPPPSHGTSGTGAPVEAQLGLVVILLAAGALLMLIGRRRKGTREI